MPQPVEALLAMCHQGFLVKSGTGKLEVQPEDFQANKRHAIQVVETVCAIEFVLQASTSDMQCMHNAPTNT